MFVNSAGDVLNAEQEAALQAYVQDGGGFVGIGETAKLEEGGNAFFDTLIGLTGASRTTASSAVSSQDVEFLDRVHPATRDLSALVKGRSDNYYAWTNNPTGQVHTVARVRFNTANGVSVTNDAVQRFTGNANTLQPQQQRALSWCRDLQSGRSFYTGMGQTVGAYDDALKKHIGSAVQWAAGMVRGGCKATINSNYTQTRLTPSNPTIPAQPVSETTVNANPYMGEIDALAMAADGRIFYAGRAVCFQGQQQFTQWTHPTTGLGCGPIHVYDPRGEGSHRPEPGAHHQGRRLHGPGRQGRRRRDRQHRQDRARHPRHRPGSAVRRRGREPQLHLRRLPPVLRRHDGPQHGHEPRPGLRPRRLHGGAPPLALHLQRDDEDAQRRADRPPLHDAGLLLLPPRRLDGLRLAGQPVLRHRRQHGQQPRTRPTAATPTRTRSTRSRARATPT